MSRENEVFERIYAQLREETHAKEIRLRVLKTGEPGIAESKLGGTAYWPEGKEYPKDTCGQPMLLLAQFNCEQLPKTGKLPEHGMLQFFLEKGRWKDAAVIYHEEIDPTVTEATAIASGAIDASKLQKIDSPVRGEYAVEKQLRDAYIGPSDYRFEEMYNKLAAEEDSDDFEDLDLSNDYWTELYAANAGHHLLGYPYFTQFDPRDKKTDRDVLLFQLDSEYSKNAQQIMWGDAGIGNYFINEKDLERRDFSSVFFSWDCC